MLPEPETTLDKDCPNHPWMALRHCVIDKDRTLEQTVGIEKMPQAYEESGQFPIERLELLTIERREATANLDEVMSRWFTALQEARSEGHTLAEVGKAAGITGERVRQLLVEKPFGKPSTDGTRMKLHASDFRVEKEAQ